MIWQKDVMKINRQGQAKVLTEQGKEVALALIEF